MKTSLLSGTVMISLRADEHFYPFPPRASLEKLPTFSRPLTRHSGAYKLETRLKLRKNGIASETSFARL